MSYLRERAIQAGLAPADLPVAGQDEIVRGSLERGFWLRPFKYLVTSTPKTFRQHIVVRTLQDQLGASGFGTKIGLVPDENSPKEELSEMVVVLGNGRWNQYSRKSFELYGKFPEPKPRFFWLNTVDKLPDNIDFDSARQQIARGGASHEGMIVETDGEGKATGALWISMQGNFAVVRGSAEEIWADMTERVIEHFGVDYMTDRRNCDGKFGERLTWDRWISSPVHRDMKDVVLALAGRGWIEDKVPLKKYCEDDPVHARILESIINKGLGESMRGTWVGELGVFVASRSGAEKVSWNPDPRYRYLIPVAGLTRKGYVVTAPDGAPFTAEGYMDASVETRENTLAIVAKQLVDLGIVNNFADFYRWHELKFPPDGNVMIPIAQDGAPKYDIAIEHIHWQPIEGSYDPNFIEVVEPDYSICGNHDHPCGSEGGQWSFITALFNSKAFLSRGKDGDPFKGKVIVVKMPGHGMAVLGKSSREIKEALLYGMKLQKPQSV